MVHGLRKSVFTSYEVRTAAVTLDGDCTLCRATSLVHVDNVDGNLEGHMTMVVYRLAFAASMGFVVGIVVAGSALRDVLNWPFWQWGIF